jgi:hypothetical protein
MPELTIIISPDGSKVTTDVEGITGSSCEDLTENLFKALGTIQESEKKPEFYVEETECVSCKT